MQVTAWKPLSNSWAHITFGKRRGAGKGLKLAACYAGSAHLENRIIELKAVIDSVRPHIFGISEFPLVPMGVLAPGSAYARPFARPLIDVSLNFPAHVSAKSP